jgi:hypothetical protein
VVTTRQELIRTSAVVVRMELGSTLLPKRAQKSREVAGDVRMCVEANGGQKRRRVDFSNRQSRLGEELRRQPHLQPSAGAGLMDVSKHNERSRSTGRQYVKTATIWRGEKA